MAVARFNHPRITATAINRRAARRWTRAALAECPLGTARESRRRRAGRWRGRRSTWSWSTFKVCSFDRAIPRTCRAWTPDPVTAWMDGRHRIGSTPAAGDAGSANTPASRCSLRLPRSRTRPATSPAENCFSAQLPRARSGSASLSGPSDSLRGCRESRFMSPLAAVRLVQPDAAKCPINAGDSGCQTFHRDAPISAPPAPFV